MWTSYSVDKTDRKTQTLLKFQNNLSRVETDKIFHSQFKQRLHYRHVNAEIKQKAFVFLVLKLVQSVAVVFQCPWNYFFLLFYDFERDQKGVFGGFLHNRF